MVQLVKQLSSFMEMDEAMALYPTDDKAVWCLSQERQPYGPGMLLYVNDAFDLDIFFSG